VAPSTSQETFGCDLCWNCHADPGKGLVCAHCAKLQPLDDRRDYFELLGYPRRLDLDPGDVERRYHELSRRFHPDFYQTASPRERELSVAISAALNASYQTLRDPMKRAEYLLRLEGVDMEERKKRVPPGLSDALFQAQEMLWRLRADPGDAEVLGQVREAHARFRERHAQASARLRQHAAAWGERPEQPQERERILDALADTVSEMAYLQTILRDLEQALEGGKS